MTGAGTGRPRVVVGIDGSTGSRAALAWALSAARARSADVEALIAFPIDFYWTDAYLADPGQIKAVRAETRARATTLVHEVREEVAVATGEPAPPVDVVVVAGVPAQHLVRESEKAALLVVGSRGRGGVRSTLLGSVALHCSAHARCPVVVVHPAFESPAPRVVVGVEDSPSSRAALRLAFDEAVRLEAELEIVAAYRHPNYWSDLYAVMLPPAGQTREQAATRAGRIAAEVLGEEADRCRVRLTVAEGEPGDVLVRTAAGARLLVVGSQSRTAFEGMVLGSVALHCVVHAGCPVMVVHPERAVPAAGAGARQQVPVPERG